MRNVVDGRRFCRGHLCTHNCLVYGKPEYDRNNTEKGYHLIDKKIDFYSYVTDVNELIRLVCITRDELLLRTLIYTSMFPYIVSNEGHITWINVLKNSINEGIRAVYKQLSNDDVYNDPYTIEYTKPKKKRMNSDVWIEEDMAFATYDSIFFERELADLLQCNGYAEMSSDVYNDPYTIVYTRPKKKRMYTDFWVVKDKEFAIYHIIL